MECLVKIYLPMNINKLDLFQGDEEDVYICSQIISPVTAKSYGTYTATVSNIAGPLYVSFVLKPYGKRALYCNMLVIKTLLE